jgi:hypothetical protein
MMEKIDRTKAANYEHLVSEINKWSGNRIDIGMKDFFWLSHQELLFDFPDCLEKEFVLELIKKERKKLADKMPETVLIRRFYHFSDYADVIKRLNEEGIITNELFPRFMQLYDIPDDFTPILWKDTPWKLVVLMQYFCNRGILPIDGTEKDKPKVNKFIHKKDYGTEKNKPKVNEFIVKNFRFKNSTELTNAEISNAVSQARRRNYVGYTKFIKQLLPIFGI